MTTPPDAVTRFAPKRERDEALAVLARGLEPKKSEGQILLDRIDAAMTKLAGADQRVATAVRDIEGEASQAQAILAEAQLSPRGTCGTMAGFFPNLRRLTEDLEGIADRVDVNSARLVDKF